jgi:Ca-activated chloride channel family protein
LASLEQLDAQQHFQIIFYNVAAMPMRTGDRRNNMLAGDDQSKALARQFIAEKFRPDGGTDHRTALREGLRTGADVMFFLTDGEEPKMSAGELDEIRRLNRGACQIHVIQFGEQAPLNLDSWLKQLARQNGGSYRYRQASR